MKGIQDARTTNHSFAIGKKYTQVETRTHWAKGTVYYGVLQNTGVTGTSGTRYDVSYKKDDTKWIVQYKNGYVKKNNTYYGEWFMHSSNGKNKYSYKVDKTTLTNSASKLTIDFMLK